MPPPYKVLDFEYPGLPEIARTAISQLAPEGEWVSSSGARVELYEHKFLPDGKLSPHYGEWVLRLRSSHPQDRSRCATIEVRELWGELLPWGEPQTALIFSDARDATWTLEKPEPMGDILKGLYRAVHMEAHRIAGQRPAQAEAQGTVPDEDGADSPNKAWEFVEQKEAAGDILPIRLEIGGKFGTHRDLTANDVQAIVDRCRYFMRAGGKVPDFYDQLAIVPDWPRYFELETLRGWLKNPRFASKDSEN